MEKALVGSRGLLQISFTQPVFTLVLGVLRGRGAGQGGEEVLPVVGGGRAEAAGAGQPQLGLGVARPGDITVYSGHCVVHPLPPLRVRAQAGEVAGPGPQAVQARPLARRVCREGGPRYRPGDIAARLDTRQGSRGHARDRRDSRHEAEAVT